MVSDIGGVQSLDGRYIEFYKGWDLCLCGSGCGGIDGGNGDSGVGDSDESIVHRSGGSVVYRIGGGGLCRSS